MTPILKKYTFIDGSVITVNNAIDIFTRDAFSGNSEPLTEDYLMEMFNKEAGRRLQFNGKIYVSK